MEVILLKSLPPLGDRGDTVKVTPGYARNYLFPRRIAVLATDGSSVAPMDGRACAAQPWEAPQKRLCAAATSRCCLSLTDLPRPPKGI